MKRRELITLLGSAAAWPLGARAQHPTLPVVGFLHGGSLAAFAPFLDGFHRGLKETGYTEGKNVVIDYRWAEGHHDRLPLLAADLVNRQGIVAITTASCASSERASKMIPIV